MPSILASSVLSKVQTLLQDSTNVRWTQAEILGWLNDGQRAICIVRPDACSKLTSIPTVAGTKQTIPADGSAILKVIRNMGAGGATPGAVVRKVPMELLDSSLPNWHAATATNAAQHFTTDARSPRTFYLYPPSTGAHMVEALYAAPPVDVGSFTGSATYSQSGTTVTVTLAAHGYSVGGWVYFAPSTGTAVAGFFQVTAVTSSTFTFTAAGSLTTSGNATVSSVLSIDDVYSLPLIDYIAFRCYSKDNDMMGNKERAAGHWEIYKASLGDKAASDGVMNQTPNNVAG